MTPNFSDAGVPAPDLHDISVHVPAPEGFTSEDLGRRFVEMAREHATVQVRDPLELVGEGDEVCCDVAGYWQGKLIPSSVRTDAWITLEPEPLLPGLYEALVDQPVGSRFPVDLTFPEEYPVAWLRSQPARFIVEIKSAREVRMPDFEDPAFLAAFGRGGTLDEAMKSVARQMEEEEAQLLLLQAKRRVLDELIARTPVAMSEDAVDAEIRRRWLETEGKALAARPLSKEDRLEALNLWLRDPDVRSEVEGSLVIGLALGAICRRDGIALTEDDVKSVVREQSEAAGVPVEETLESLRQHPEVMKRIEHVALHLKAVDHVMRHAKVHFEGADAPAA